MSFELHQILARADDAGWQEALCWAGAFIGGFASAETRRSYQRDLHCWFGFCTTHDLHPYKGVRRTHVELYLRELERQQPQRLSNATLYRRISTLSSWFVWLEDEEVVVSNPAARVRRPSRHPRPQPWLNRNELADLLAAGEDEGGYALVCLLALNGLRVSEACGADITDLVFSRCNYLNVSTGVIPGQGLVRAVQTLKKLLRLDTRRLALPAHAAGNREGGQARPHRAQPAHV